MEQIRCVGTHERRVVAIRGTTDLSLADENGKVQRRFEVGQWVHSVHVAAERYLVATVGTGINAEGFRVWDLSRREPAWLNTDVFVSDYGVVAVHPARPVFAFESSGFRIFDASTEQEIGKLPEADRPDLFSFTAVNTVAYVDEDRLRVVAASRWNELFALPIHQESGLQSLQADPLTGGFILGFEDGALEFVASDTTSRRVQTHQGISDLRISPCGKHIALTGDQNALFLIGRDGTSMLTLPSDTRSVFFDPYANRVVCVVDDKLMPMDLPRPPY